MERKDQSFYILLIVKYIVFNVMYLPMLLGFQELLFGRKFSHSVDDRSVCGRANRAVYL